MPAGFPPEVGVNWPGSCLGVRVILNAPPYVTPCWRPALVLPLVCVFGNAGEFYEDASLLASLRRL